DCSPDKSRDVVLEFQRKHDNLKLITHEENKCLGGARNTGINAARGKYLWFVDSDDMIRPNCLKTLVSLCEKDELDVLMFNFEKINLAEIKKEIVFSDSMLMNGVGYIHQYFKNDLVYHLGYAWRQIYKVDYLKTNQLYFPEHVFWEDTVFMPKALFYAERVRSVSDIYYQYRINPFSVSGVYDKELRADLIFQFAFHSGKDLLDFSKEIEVRDSEIAGNLRSKALWYINGFIFRLLKAPIEQKKIFFQLIKSNPQLKNQLIREMNLLNKILCRYPDLGYYISLVFSPAYQLKLKLKK
ncbi:MAG: glycosyltransferase, partial [Bacteroidales bacterium]|nr:glycosyltransferase [Bacteroidales bacterium]